MMPEEIRSTHIEQPRRVRPPAKEEREQRGENRDRFSRDLASLAHEDPAGRHPGSHPDILGEQAGPDAEDEIDLAGGTEDETSPPRLGRNLDITT